MSEEPGFEYYSYFVLFASPSPSTSVSPRKVIEPHREFGDGRV
jgi:hypothetical protein